jgi:hypothetical protein
MLLPSVAISLAIHYLGNIVTPTPDNTIATISVFLPATLMALVLWQRQRSGK